MRIRLLEPPDVSGCLGTWPMPGIDAVAATAVASRGLAEGRLGGAVIEDPFDGRMLGFGLSGFVGGAVVDAAQALDRPLMLHILQAESQGERVLLHLEELQAWAAQDDLHLVVLAYRQRSFDPADAQAQELLNAGHKAYRLMHEGYRLRAVWQEGDEADAAWLCAGGMLVKRAYRSDGLPTGRILFGASAEDFGSTWPSHTVSFMFRPRTARLRLTPMQRRVASLALWNLSDDEVAHRLGISADTVRQHWRGIVSRVLDTHPAILGAATSKASHGGRGPEKRSDVLEFLRGNLHEVRSAH
jgi:hypothetical protein